MDSVAVAFAIPSRVALETGDGGRCTGYVTHFEGGCIWAYVRGLVSPSFRSSVRLVFRRDGESSLGMAGLIIWSAQDRVAVEVQHPVDRAIVRQWSRGEVADVSEFVRLDRTEVPTAEFSPVAAVAMAMNGAEITDASVAAERVIRRRARASIDGSWRDRDTLEDRVSPEPFASEPFREPELVEARFGGARQAEEPFVEERTVEERYSDDRPPAAASSS